MLNKAETGHVGGWNSANHFSETESTSPGTGTGKTVLEVGTLIAVLPRGPGARQGLKGGGWGPGSLLSLHPGVFISENSPSCTQDLCTFLNVSFTLHYPIIKRLLSKRIIPKAPFTEMFRKRQRGHMAPVTPEGHA